MKSFDIKSIKFHINHINAEKKEDFIVIINYFYIFATK